MKNNFAFFLLTFLLSSLNAFPGGYRLPEGVTPEDYAANTIILRVKNDYRQACGNEHIALEPVKQILSEIGASSVKKMFPHHQPPGKEFNEIGFRYADLSLIYEIRYSRNADLVKTINSLVNTGLLEYAEPKFIPKVNYIPNDPQISQQTFLQRINAYAGWDISKGDTNVVIGITDTGTDWDHPDLAANIKYNYADPINGIDDDGDLYIDNYRGWDVGENDNDPTIGNCGICFHGSHVSGCAAAVTDNGTGVASPGFFSRFLPVKIANASGALASAYEGIVYAADHGCQIINCSWGGGGGGTFGQNIIDYATINKNALVIAAAGNNGSNQLYYPAAYNHVFCVASTNTSTDIKSGFSNYGIFVDVCAPGNDIYSTIADNAYSTSSGTSMSAPVAAGVAAVVKAQFPAYNAWQIGEQVRITADNIYSIAGNFTYQDQLGSGRVNMLNALTLTGPSVRMNPINISDNNDNVFIVDDTLYITGNIINYLDPTVNLSALLTTSSPFVTIIDDLHMAGALPTMGMVNNNGDPFTVKINSNAPKNIQIPFKILFQDGSYNDFQMFVVTVNVDYLNITINDIWTTNSSKGRIAYNGNNQTEGLGFDFLNNGSLAYETGFMAGTASSVSDNVRGTGTAIDNDWLPVNVIQKAAPGPVADYETFGSFNDNLNPAPLSLSVNHRSYTWSAPPNHRYHIFEYTLHNTGGSPLSNLYAGIFSDWDIQDYNHNKASEDVNARMGYVWNTDSGGYYAGIKLLTPAAFIHYAIDNILGGGGGVDLTNGYPDTEKFITLSTNRSLAGTAGLGNDVIDVVSTGPFFLNAGDSVTVAFALLAGTSLNDLLESAANAQLQYDPMVGIHEMENQGFGVYPNPAQDYIYIYPETELRGRVQVTLSDVSGRMIMQTLLSENEKNHRIATEGLSNGFYIIELLADEYRFSRKILINGK